MAYGALIEVYKGTTDCFYTHHARYRGNTALDAHLGRVKRTIDNAPVGRWPHAEREITELPMYPETIDIFRIHPRPDLNQKLETAIRRMLSERSSQLRR